MAGWDKGGSGALERIATLGAAALGLVGYLYALGGIVIWLRMQTAQLSSGAVVAVNDRHLLAVGVSVVAFELFVLVAISAVVAAVVAVGVLIQKWKGDSNPAPGASQSARESDEGKTEESEPEPVLGSSKLGAAWDDEGTLAGCVFPVTGLLLVTVGLSLPGPTWHRAVLWIVGLATLLLAAVAMIFRLMPWIGARLGERLLHILTVALLVLALAFGIFAMPLLQGTLLLAGTALIYFGPFLKWPDLAKGDIHVRELLRSAGLWVALAATTLVALAWVATPPVAFTQSTVESLDHMRFEKGAYLDRGDGGIYVGSCTLNETNDDGYQTSTESRVTLVPGEESERVRLGQATYHFDPGGRPSVWQTIKIVIGGGVPGVHDAYLLHHPLRGQVKDVCGPDR